MNVFVIIMKSIVIILNAISKRRLSIHVFLYIFQYENHAKSLKLEESTLFKIKTRIEEKVMNNSGTWIDWQYLLHAAVLLKKVHTLPLLIFQCFISTYLCPLL